jgi:uncharacterized protein (DUF2164 family)
LNTIWLIGDYEFVSTQQTNFNSKKKLEKWLNNKKAINVDKAIIRKILNYMSRNYGRFFYSNSLIRVSACLQRRKIEQA